MPKLFSKVKGEYMDVKENDLIGNVEKLLYNILNELREINKKLTEHEEEVKEEIKPKIDFEGMKRVDLLKLVKGLDNPPSTYPKMRNVELIEVLKGSGKYD